MHDQGAQGSRRQQGIGKFPPDWQHHLFEKSFIQRVVAGKLRGIQQPIQGSPDRFAVPDPCRGFQVP
ncbi:MAG TPA: hypothetical protein DCY42_03055 [Chloroflexi bacterium]|nr:hypothetical protein [Chloroflexota bacterium]